MYLKYLPKCKNIVELINYSAYSDQERYQTVFFYSGDMEGRSDNVKVFMSV